MKKKEKDKKRAIEDFVSRLKALFGGDVKRVILFGSHARGGYSEKSDVDVMVVVKRRTLALQKKVVDISFDILLEYNVDISPKIYSLEEFEMESKLGAPFIKNVENEGITIP